MSRMRAYRPETVAVMERFFKALDTIIENRMIRGVQTYCNDYGIDKRHLYAQRKDLYIGFFEIYWILPMIQKFGVSPEWLLFGKGDMFRKKRKKSDAEDKDNEKGEHDRFPFSSLSPIPPYLI